MGKNNQTIVRNCRAERYKNFMKNDLLELFLLLQDSKNSYDEYLKNENSFHYTKKIRLTNGKILSLISNKFFFTSVDLDKLISELKEHLIDWITLWDKETLRLKPKELDKFIFSGYKQYPKDLDKVIKQYLSID